MNLHSDNTYWPILNGLGQVYPSLKTDLKTDIVVLGAGITGALCAWHLVRAGLEVSVLDRRHVGQGSTAASTALLQYEIDTPLHKLAGYVGLDNAARAYHVCREAIDGIGDICAELGQDCGFKRVPSCYYASRKADLPEIKKEYEIRKAQGFELELLDRPAIRKIFGLYKWGGLLSEDGGQVDPFQLTQALLADCARRGARIFDNTEIKHIDYQKRGVHLTTARGQAVKAKQMIVACGYESQQYLGREVEIINSSYAIVSEPIPGQGDIWHKNALIWETARPYLYLRTTADRRILVGGKDEPFYNPEKRDALVHKKARQLEQSFKKLFPEIPFVTDFQWAGTFVETKDGLPYIGAVPERPHTFFALGFGGNGITFSLVAAQMLTEALQGKSHPDAPIFAFERESKAEGLGSWLQTTRSWLSTLMH